MGPFMYLGGEGLTSSYWAYLLSACRAAARLSPAGITGTGVEDWRDVYTVEPRRWL